MSNLEVAESSLAIPMAYNSQQTNPSKYQKRQVNYLYPTQNTPLDSGSSSSMIYRFLVPSDMFLDSKASYLSCEAFIYNGAGLSSQVAINPADTVYFSSFTDTWIQRITILTSTGIKIEEIIDANVLAAMMKRELEPALLNSVGRESLACWDIGNVGGNVNMAYNGKQKQYYSTNPGTDNKSNPNRFVIPLKMSGFLQSFNYLPLKAMSQGQSNAFQIEIQFASPRTMITAYTTGTGEGTAQTSTTPYNYVIQSCYYVMNLIKDDEKEAEIMEIIKSTPLILSYQTHNHYGTTIQGTTGTNQSTISVTEYQESVSEIKFAFTNSKRINNPACDFGVFNNPNLQQVQLQIGNFYTPSQPTPCGKSMSADAVYIPLLAEQYLNNAVCAQKWHNDVKGFQPSHIQPNTTTPPYVLTTDYKDLVIYFNLRVFQDDAVGDALYNQYTSGINTRSNPVPLQFIFTNLFGLTNLGNAVYELGTAANPTAYSVDAFTTYRANLVIQRGENYVIS